MKTTILNWRWWVVLPYVALIAGPLTVTFYLLRVACDEWDNWAESYFRAPIDWWRSSASSKVKINR